MTSYRCGSRLLVNTARTAVQGIMNKHVAFHTKCILACFTYINVLIFDFCLAALTIPFSLIFFQWNFLKGIQRKQVVVRPS